MVLRLITAASRNHMHWHHDKGDDLDRKRSAINLVHRRYALRET